MTPCNAKPIPSVLDPSSICEQNTPVNAASHASAMQGRERKHIDPALSVLRPAYILCIAYSEKPSMKWGQ